MRAWSALSEPKETWPKTRRTCWQSSLRFLGNYFTDSSKKSLKVKSVSCLFSSWQHLNRAPSRWGPPRRQRWTPHHHRISVSHKWSFERQNVSSNSLGWRTSAEFFSCFWTPSGCGKVFVDDGSQSRSLESQSYRNVFGLENNLNFHLFLRFCRLFVFLWFKSKFSSSFIFLISFCLIMFRFSRWN